MSRITNTCIGNADGSLARRDPLGRCNPLARCEPLAWPLSDTAWLVETIAAVTGRGEDDVRRRFDSEQRSLGSSVAADLRARGLTPHVWSEGLAEFYRTSDAFLYESVAWSRYPFKQSLVRRVARSLRFADKPLRVLVYGDGPGFDSLSLARCGHEVTYFEVGQRGIAFAKRLFAATEMPVAVCTNPADLPLRGFDAVVCLDVLEHVPDPRSLVAELVNSVRPGGRLVVNAPFHLVTAEYATHLSGNRRFSGSLSLFQSAGLRLVDGHWTWSPLVFGTPQSSDLQPPPLPAAPAMRLRKRAGIGLAGWVLKTAAVWSTPFGWLSQLRKPDPRWLEETAASSADAKTEPNRAAA
jgi:SAM-dependent methyltransferase